MDERSERNGREVKIKLLIMVALADGKLHPREVTTLEMLAAKFGISHEEFERIKGDPAMDVSELIAGLPNDNAGRIDLLADLLRVAFADKEIHDSELELLTKLGKALGFEADEVRAIIDEM